MESWWPWIQPPLRTGSTEKRAFRASASLRCISSILSEPPGNPSFIPKSQHTQPLVSGFLAHFSPSHPLPQCPLLLSSPACLPQGLPPPPTPPTESILSLGCPCSLPWHLYSLATAADSSKKREGDNWVSTALPEQGHMLCSWASIHTSMYKPWGFGWATGTVILLTLEGSSEDELRHGIHSSQHSAWPRVSPQ